jgi:hypothetical protein
MFPAPDPIPLPAPVWVMKTLHIVTLSLHFLAIYIVVGALALALVWHLFGKRGTTQGDAATALTPKLPVAMTYLVNLGIPPLLFAQVLYGRALYTSSILIGAYWLAVIFLLILGYYLLYVIANRSEKGQSWWLLGLVSLVVITYIGRIYASNMTLMLRPEAWAAMYAGNDHGTILPKGDPTVLPRWLFIVVGSLSVGGVFVMLVGLQKSLRDEVRAFLHRGGALAATGFGLLQIGIGFWAYNVQPAVVRDGLAAKPLYHLGEFAWIGASALTVVAAGAALAVKKGWIVPAVAALGAFLSTTAMTIVRDGIRDLTLLSKGFDVWAQPVASNWQIVLIFLVLFVAGLGVIGWMVWLLQSAKGVRERHV